jgi:predicted metal-dependent phosphotriesterase family hydrolase
MKHLKDKKNMLHFRASDEDALALQIMTQREGCNTLSDMLRTLIQEGADRRGIVIGHLETNVKSPCAY